MLKPSKASATKKRLPVLCVKTLMLLLLCGTTALAGDITGDLSNNYENSTVDSNNASETVTNNYNATGAGSAAPVMSSVAPTMMGGGGNDSCLLPRSTGIQLSVVGISSGSMKQDEHCNRRKNARLLGTPQQLGGLGLQVSAISILCSDATVFKAMALANTPCPISSVSSGKLLMGRQALEKYRQEPELYIVGYKDDKAFWDALLLVGEELTQDEETIDTGPRLSLSERFRSSRKR